MGRIGPPGCKGDPGERVGVLSLLSQFFFHILIKLMQRRLLYSKCLWNFMDDKKILVVFLEKHTLKIN